jgi:hypothetical protein
MMRQAAAAALALCLIPSWLSAQSKSLTVNAASVDVHKYPSIGSPVIGKAPRGARLEVTRELGSWVKILWPDAKDGAGYVHVRMGKLVPPVEDRAGYVQQSVESIARRSTRDPNAGAGRTSTPRGRESAPRTTKSGQAEQTRSAERLASAQAVYIATPSHIVGLGGRMGGSALGFGATARAWPWSRNRLGIQLEVSRTALTSTVAPGRLTSIQLAPSLLHSLKDRVSDYVWVRPYVGAGASFSRSIFSGASDIGGSVADKSLGFQAFGGGELTFPNVPRFALSADLGYQWARTPFTGFEVGALRFSVSGHWYVK